MIRDITLTFCEGNISYSMRLPELSDNIPYDLADMFAELIRKTNANENMVIENLMDEFGYNNVGG